MTKHEDPLLTLTPAQRAFVFEQLHQRPARGQKPPLVPRTDAAVLPLSFAQHRLWYFQQLAPESPLYSIAHAWRLSGNLDVIVLECSLKELVRRHEVLRTSFPQVAGQPVQHIASLPDVALPITDLTMYPRGQREQELSRRLVKEAARPFSVETGPLLRAQLLRLDADEHVLLLTGHHIVLDGWSQPILARELSHLYAANLVGQPAVLPRLDIQYADYALWQRQWLQGAILEQGLEFWREYLAGAAPQLALPTDHPRPASQSYRGAHLRFTLPPALTAKLQALQVQEQVTMFVLLLAAFEVLLWRYTGQPDVVIGTPVANRTHPAVEPLIGFFVNTLPLRVDLSDAPRFTKLLQQVRQRALDVLSHQEIPLERIVEAVAPERTLSSHPLFQVVFAFQQTETEALQLANVRVMPIHIARDTTKFDLTFNVEEEQGNLSGYIEYSTDLFEPSTIQRMFGHWQTLLEGIVANPEQSIATLPLLTEDERLRILVEWNATQADYPQHQGLHHLFEQQAERAPEAVAVVCESTQLTYQQLNERANRLAHGLRKLGVGPETLVGLCLERSLNLLVGMLGILKTGGAYVPLDPSYPAERLAFMLEDTQAPLILTEALFLTALPPGEWKILCLDRDWPSISRESSENLDGGATAENLAYIMYTSGSTGVPKGVEICHRSIARLVWNANYVTLDTTKTLLHLSSSAFDASTFEVWGALLHGARCVLYPERIPTPSGIKRAIEAHQVTTLFLTTVLFNLLIDEAPEILRPVEEIFTGGEAHSVAHIRRALEALPTTRISNIYGPTESTTFATWYPLPQTLGARLSSIPIGRPITNTQVYILDAQLRLAPIGVPGELYLGGDGLARGYHHRPDLTEERFLPHPFSSQPGARLYKTGDLARWLPDGNIEFLGRVDQQFKIRGFRIEPGEIEVALCQHPGIRAAHVLRYELSPRDARLVAYVTAAPHEKAALQSVDLRQYLAQRLPAYLVPGAFVVLEQFPLMANGKIDRTALPLPRWQPEQEGLLPQTSTEESISHIWAEIFHLDQVGRDANFFDLGGHSLLAAEVITRLRTVFAQPIPLRLLFEHQTVASLADAIRQQSRAACPEDVSNDVSERRTL